MHIKNYYKIVMFITLLIIMAFTPRNPGTLISTPILNEKPSLTTHYSQLTIQNSPFTPLPDTSWPLDIKALDHKGKTVQSSEWPVTFTTALHNDYYQSDSINRKGYLYLETQIDRFINESAKRVPLNLSIVIDRSGSMGGDKIMYAIEAAKFLVDKLTPDDFVSIVMYDQSVNVVQATTRVLDKKMIKTKIDQITIRGSTNLWGGTEKGFEEVKSNYRPSYINRVLLISDGLANVGLTDSALIKIKVQQYKDLEGITLSTFGVGLDYNEVLMTDMAEAGAGNYYFINSADKMTSLFEKELNGMQNVAAQNAQLIIHLPEPLQLEKVFAFKYEYSKNQVIIKFRDLFSEEIKGILMKFNIPDHTNSVLKFNASISYDDVKDGKRKSLSNENILTPTKDTITYLTYFNQPVIQQTLLFITNEKIEQAMHEADKGNYNLARKFIHYNDSFLRRNNYYVSTSRELKRVDSANNDYLKRILNAETLNEDAIKLIQKSNRAEFYKVRNKKQ